MSKKACSKKSNSTHSAFLSEFSKHLDEIFIEQLTDITSYYVNEHIVNLLLEVRGKLPEDKGTMLAIINSYLSMSAEDKLNFAVGRRLGYYYYLKDMQNEAENLAATKYIKENPNTDFTLFCNECRAEMI